MLILLAKCAYKPLMIKAQYKARCLFLFLFFPTKIYISAILTVTAHRLLRATADNRPSAKGPKFSRQHFEIHQPCLHPCLRAASPDRIGTSPGCAGNKSNTEHPLSRLPVKSAYQRSRRNLQRTKTNISEIMGFSFYPAQFFFVFVCHNKNILQSLSLVLPPHPLFFPFHVSVFGTSRGCASVAFAGFSSHKKKI